MNAHGKPHEAQARPARGDLVTVAGVAEKEKLSFISQLVFRGRGWGKGEKKGCMAMRMAGLPSGNTVDDHDRIIVDEAGYLIVSAQIALQAGGGADTSKEVTA